MADEISLKRLLELSRLSVDQLDQLSQKILTMKTYIQSLDKISGLDEFEPLYHFSDQCQLREDLSSKSPRDAVLSCSEHVVDNAYQVSRVINQNE